MAMLSVVILTHNSEEGLARTLASLVSAAAEGVIREVVVVDACSTDGTSAVAEAAGCLLVTAAGASWGDRVGSGIASMRRAPWIMILQPHVLLEGEWYREVSAFIERIERAGRSDSKAAAFRLAYDEFGAHARFAEQAVGLCSGVFGLPVPEQGLIFSRRLWDRVRLLGPATHFGRLVSRIGRRQIKVLRASAV